MIDKRKVDDFVALLRALDKTEKKLAEFSEIVKKNKEAILEAKKCLHKLNPKK